MFWHRGKSREPDLGRELRSDFELEAEEQRQTGLSSDEAHYAARRAFCNTTFIQEEVQQMWRWISVEQLSQDLRYALRVLHSAPGFSATAVLTIALGIGANTAIFSLINTVLLHALPVKDPKQLVLFGTAEGNFGGDFAQVGAWGAYSLPLYRQFKKQNVYFHDLCAFQSYTSRLSVRINGSPARVAMGKVVSGNYFSVLGVPPYLGRTLQAEDDQANGIQPAVVSYRAWVRLFAKDSTIIGRQIDVNGKSITIVGVAPPEFFGEKIETEPADFWMPLRLQPIIMLQSSFLEDPEMNWLNVIGRLKSGADVRKAQAHLTNILQQFLTTHSGTNLASETKRLISTCYVPLTPGGRGISELRKRFSEPLHILMALVGLVLLIACANVANLLLARAAGRQTEIAMRLVLGAKRIRVIRQLLTESLLLAILGGFAGIAIAWWSTKFLVRLLSGGEQLLPLDTTSDLSVLAFTALVSFAAMLLFGLAPALESTKVDLAPSLKGCTNGTAAALNRVRISVAELLVVGQLSLSVLLLGAGGLLIAVFSNSSIRTWDSTSIMS
jgi:predicted permease